MLTISNNTWEMIIDLTKKRDSSDLVSTLCSLDNFPELYVAYRKLCRCQTRAFYHVIANDSETS